MPKLPRMSGEDAVKVFRKLGFLVARQRGSHIVMRRGDRGCVIPLHRELAVGTLRNAIRQAGITVEEFVEAWQGK